MSLTALDDTAVATDRVTTFAHGLKALAAVPVQPPEQVVLRDYSRAVLALTGEQAAALNRVGGGRYLSVEPGEHSGHRRVSAHNFVGSINVAGLQVLVRPKIPLRNLFLLLEVGLRERDWHDEAVHFETTGDLLPALVSFFARTTETALARGLYHSYREQHDQLVALRGRIDIAGQLTQPGVAIPTACSFTEFAADLIENSYLKAAVRVHRWSEAITTNPGHWAMATPLHWIDSSPDGSPR